MRVLFCGDRNWSDAEAISKAFDQHPEISTVIEGEARGADKMAAAEARRRDLVVLAFPADWEKYGRAAGPIRNQQMLDLGKPDLVIAFHHDLDSSKGTADMVRRAARVRIPVEIVV